VSKSKSPLDLGDIPLVGFVFRSLRKDYEIAKVRKKFSDDPESSSFVLKGAELLFDKIIPSLTGDVVTNVDVQRVIQSDRCQVVQDRHSEEPVFETVPGEFVLTTVARRAGKLNASISNLGSNILTRASDHFESEVDRLEAKRLKELISSRKNKLLWDIAWSASAGVISHLVGGVPLSQFASLVTPRFSGDLTGLKYVQDAISMLEGKEGLDAFQEMLAKADDVRLAELESVMKKITDIVEISGDAYAVIGAPLLEEGLKKKFGWKIVFGISIIETLQQCPFGLTTPPGIAFLIGKLVIHGSFYLLTKMNFKWGVLAHSSFNSRIVGLKWYRRFSCAYKKKSNGPPLQCSYCDKLYHTADTCFSNPQSKAFKKKKGNGSGKQTRSNKSNNLVNASLGDLVAQKDAAEDALKDVLLDVEEILSGGIANAKTCDDKPERLPRDPAPPHDSPDDDEPTVEDVTKFFVERLKTGNPRMGFDEGKKAIAVIKIARNNSWNKFLRCFKPVVDYLNGKTTVNLYKYFNYLVVFDTYTQEDTDKYLISLVPEVDYSKFDFRADVHTVIDVKHLPKICSCRHFIYKEFPALMKLEIIMNPSVYDENEFMTVTRPLAVLEEHHSKLELELFVQLTHVGLMDNSMDESDARRAIIRNAKRLCTINYDRYAHLKSNHLQIMSLHYAKAYLGYQFLESVSELGFRTASPQKRDCIVLDTAPARRNRLLFLSFPKRGLSSSEYVILSLSVIVLWKWFQPAPLLKVLPSRTVIQTVVLLSSTAFGLGWGK
jgi:hypothetical protein